MDAPSVHVNPSSQWLCRGLSPWEWKQGFACWSIQSFSLIRLSFYGGLLAILIALANTMWAWTGNVFCAWASAAPVAKNCLFHIRTSQLELDHCRQQPLPPSPASSWDISRSSTCVFNITFMRLEEQSQPHPVSLLCASPCAVDPAALTMPPINWFCYYCSNRLYIDWAGQ